MLAGQAGNRPAFSLECLSSAPSLTATSCSSKTTITTKVKMNDMTLSLRATAAAEPESKGAMTEAKGGLSAADHSRVIEMAWEDRTPFEAIERLYGLPEAAVIRLMRRSLKPKAFRNWRQRVSGRVTKHGARRDPSVSRGYCATQYKQRSK
jgi:uncharacterized protein (TIGR03643 family)